MEVISDVPIYTPFHFSFTVPLTTSPNDLTSLYIFQFFYKTLDSLLSARLAPAKYIISTQRKQSSNL